MLNTVALVGQVYSGLFKVEAGRTQIGKLVLRMEENYVDKDKVPQKKENFVEVQFWGKTLEYVESLNLIQDEVVCIDGKIAGRMYQKDDGPNYFTNVIGEKISLIGRKSARQTPAKAYSQAALNPKTNEVLPVSSNTRIVEEDIPF